MEMKTHTTAFFSGHRAQRLPQDTEKLKNLERKVGEKIERAVADGYETFITGMCYGFDLMCAKEVLKLKDKYPKIKLIAAIPFEEQAKNWNEKYREIYYDILAECDETIMVNVHYKRGCFYERNRRMADISSLLICYYDGGDGGTKYTVNYAKKQNVKIINLF